MFLLEFLCSFGYNILRMSRPMVFKVMSVINITYYFAAGTK